MGKRFDGIDAELRAFIEAQHMFFVATAPLSAAGHINVSPKGLDSLRLLDPTTVAYLDFVGSGAETIAHLRENRRIVVMFCAFEGPPRIVRLHGRGRVIEPQDDEFVRMRRTFTPQMEGRSIVHVCSTAFRTRADSACRCTRTSGTGRNFRTGPRAKARKAWRSIRKRRTARASTGCPRSGGPTSA